MLKKSIALIGMPGSGKSSVGRALARIFGVQFVDTDIMVERHSGMSIREMFSRFGEETFRAHETYALKDALTTMRAVISCGGGIVLKERNRMLLRESACSVYLTASVGTLSERVGDARTRPLLYGDKRGKLTELMRERTPLYEESACVTLDTDGLGIEEAAEKAAALIRNYFETNGGKH